MRESGSCGEKAYNPAAQNKSLGPSTSKDTKDSSLIGAAWGNAKPAVHKGAYISRSKSGVISIFPTANFPASVSPHNTNNTPSLLLSNPPIAFKMMDAGVDWLCGSVPDGKSPKLGLHQSQDSDFSASLVMSCSSAPGEMVGTPAAGSENPFF
jgi:hypothetical protein